MRGTPLHACIELLRGERAVSLLTDSPNGSGFSWDPAEGRHQVRGGRGTAIMLYEGMPISSEHL